MLQTEENVARQKLFAVLCCTYRQCDHRKASIIK